MKMRLTKRDLLLMCWINKMGFVTIDQIASWLKIAKPTAYGRLKKLVHHVFLIHEPVFHGVAGIYRASFTGTEVSGSELPPLRKVNVATYTHDLKVTQLSLSLLQHFNGQYVSERELRNEDGKEVFGQAEHIADGELLLPGKRIAIEVELSKKGKRRLEKIFNHYMKSFEYQEVWYFCGSTAVQTLVQQFADKISFVRVCLLDDFLAGKVSIHEQR